MVDIIIVNHNTSELTLQTIRTVLQAKNKIVFCLSIIDNGSEKDDKYALEIGIQSFMHEHTNIKIFYKDSEKNLGFSGANNYYINKDIINDRIDYICLLNSDVIVTDGWLDQLYEKNLDIIGPITNKAGNEQTVMIPYHINRKCEDIFPVEEYARKRRKIFKEYCQKTDFVTFFCVLIKKDVFKKIGILDDRFFPGGFEDNDFCETAVSYGFTIGIARDCFVHHFGSSSFALKSNKYTHFFKKNRRKFENKRRHMHENCKWKLLLSCHSDLLFLTEKLNTGEIDSIEYNFFATSIIDFIEKQITLEKEWCGTLERLSRIRKNFIRYYFDKYRWGKVPSKFFH